MRLEKDVKISAKTDSRLENYMKIVAGLKHRCNSIKKHSCSDCAPLFPTMSRLVKDLKIYKFLSTENRVSFSESAVNINTATAEELEKLPHVGAKTAREIVNHREKFGAFRKPEHLLLVRGVSDNRFRQMRHLIKTE